MNIQSVKAMVGRIAAEECEEDQHIMEDKLYEQFIRFVATSSQDVILKEMAVEVLKTKDLDMKRHYA